MERVTEAPDFSGIDPETGERWSPRKVVRLLGLRAVNDPGEIRSICERVVSSSPEQAAQLKAGKRGLLGFFLKRVMEETRGGADPVATNRILAEMLGI